MMAAPAVLSPRSLAVPRQVSPVLPLPLAQLGDCLMRGRHRGLRPRVRSIGSFRPAEPISPGATSNPRSDGWDASFISTSSTATDGTEGGPDYLALGPTFSELGVGASASSSAPAEAARRGRPSWSWICPVPERRHLRFDEVIHSGPVAKRSRHLGLWRDRWAVLTAKHLVTFREPALHGQPTDSISFGEVFGVALEGVCMILRLRHRECPNCGVSCASARLPWQRCGQSSSSSAAIAGLPNRTASAPWRLPLPGAGAACLCSSLATQATWRETFAPSSACESVIE
ncbi:unnamed protein product [Polarella glacialis]|uniref:PH domain-containing protein n=2 Tax=Polarella glacialis TaxID=89957 RepID=A0A813FQG6_POLGL|nr:unnamed protein product [Polarella glacialis]